MTGVNPTIIKIQEMIFYRRAGPLCFLSGAASVVAVAAPPKGDPAAAISRPPPLIEASSAESPAVEAPPGTIPSPRRTRVVGLFTNSDDGPIISPIKAGPPSEGSPNPSPAPTGLLSAFTCPLHWVVLLSCCADEDGDIANPKPRSKDAFDAAAPICAAFCNNAVADIAGCGDGA